MAKVFSISHNISALQKKIKRTQRSVAKLAQQEIAKEAHRTHRDLTKETPVGWTGDTRKAWRTNRISSQPPWYRVENKKNVMHWLEHGTKTRYPRSGGKLFIPLRHSAWKAGGYQKGMKHGRDFVFAKRARGLRPLKLIPKQMNITARRLRQTLAKIGRL